MKHLPYLFLLITLCCCSTKNDNLKSVEVMTYYYHLNDDQSKLLLDSHFYSITDRDGFSEILRQILPSSQDDVSYEYKLDKCLIDDIENIAKKANEKTFDVKMDTAVIRIYCGPTIRYRINYKNGKSLSFAIDEDIANRYPKFNAFNNYYKAVTEQIKTETFNDLRANELKVKRQAFEKFSREQDSLRLPPPPLPNNGKIKFTKP